MVCVCVCVCVCADTTAPLQQWCVNLPVSLPACWPVYRTALTRTTRPLNKSLNRMHLRVEILLTRGIFSSMLSSLVQFSVILMTSRLVGRHTGLRTTECLYTCTPYTLLCDQTRPCKQCFMSKFPPCACFMSGPWVNSLVQCTMA